MRRGWHVGKMRHKVSAMRKDNAVTVVVITTAEETAVSSSLSRERPSIQSKGVEREARGSVERTRSELVILWNNDLPCTEI